MENLGDSFLYSAERCTMLLNIAQESISLEPVKQFIVESNLVCKQEFHVTLIGFAAGRQIKHALDKFNAEDRSRAEDIFMQLIKAYDWSYVMQSEYYMIEKEYSFRSKPKELRRSIVLLIKMDDIAELYKSLNSALGLELERPFPHITLATWSSDKQNIQMGIGINSLKDFRQQKPQKLTIKK